MNTDQQLSGRLISRPANGSYAEIGGPAVSGKMRPIPDIRPQHVFKIGIERCACGGNLKIIAAIGDPVVIVRILTHRCLVARAPPDTISTSVRDAAADA